MPNLTLNRLNARRRLNAPYAAVDSEVFDLLSLTSKLYGEWATHYRSSPPCIFLLLRKDSPSEKQLYTPLFLHRLVFLLFLTPPEYREELVRNLDTLMEKINSLQRIKLLDGNPLNCTFENLVGTIRETRVVKQRRPRGQVSPSPYQQLPPSTPLEQEQEQALEAGLTPLPPLRGISSSETMKSFLASQDAPKEDPSTPLSPSELIERSESLDPLLRSTNPEEPSPSEPPPKE